MVGLKSSIRPGRKEDNMRLTKPEEEEKDAGLFRCALTCGLVAAVAYDRGLRIGDMAVGWDQETGNSFFYSDLIDKIETHNQSGELYEGASEDTLQGLAVVMCAVGNGCAKTCDDIGSTICCATCPEPAVLSTVMGAGRLNER
jgi:hypothetical protein